MGTAERGPRIGSRALWVVAALMGTAGVLTACPVKPSFFALRPVRARPQPLPQPPDDESVVIRVRVVDGDGSGVAGARVRMWRAWSGEGYGEGGRSWVAERTGADGRIAERRVRHAPSVVVLAELEGRQAAARVELGILPVEGRTEEVELRLVRPSHLHVRVIDEAGSPVEGATVAVAATVREDLVEQMIGHADRPACPTDPEDPSIPMVEVDEPSWDSELIVGTEGGGAGAPHTGDDGAVRLDVRTPHAFVSVWREGFTIAPPIEVTIPEGGTVDVPVTLPRARALAGVVTGPNGAELPGGIPVEAYFADEHGCLRAFSADLDSVGRFAFEGVPAGRYLVRVHDASPYLDETVPDVVAGTSTLHIELKRGLAIRGRVTLSPEVARAVALLRQAPAAVGPIPVHRVCGWVGETTPLWRCLPGLACVFVHAGVTRCGDIDVDGDHALFSIDGLRPGTYLVTGQVADAFASSPEVTLGGSDATTTLAFPTPTGTGTVRGRVVPPPETPPPHLRNEPVWIDAAVLECSWAILDRFRGRVQRDGTFEIGGLPAGRYELTWGARFGGHPVRHRVVVVGPSETTRVGELHVAPRGERSPGPPFRRSPGSGDTSTEIRRPAP